MFKIEADPTFPATLTLIGQGREQKLQLVYRYTTPDDYTAMISDIAEDRRTVSEVILALCESWDADGTLDEASLARLHKARPGVAWAIVAAYGDAMIHARKGN